MADINQLLQDAAGDFGFSLPPPPPVEVKKAGVSVASAQKQVELGAQPNMYQIAAGGASGAGMASASDLEKDLRTLDGAALYMKYGSAAGELIKQQAAASNTVMADRSQIRSGGEAFGDTLTGVASGFAGGMANLGALGVGLVDDEAGVAASQGAKALTDLITTNQSDAVKASRLLQQARSANTSRDNKQAEADELAGGSSELVAGLRRFGRDFVDTLGNSTDSTFLAQGTADAVGSLLGGGPIAAGLRKIGAATAGKAVTNATARRVASGAAWPVATGLLEGGGAYTGSVEQVMAMSHDDLAANSEDYRNLVASGVEPEAARMQVASEAGKTAAAIQAPVGVASGYLTRALETPFRVPSVGSAIKQAAVMEPTEEAIQSSSGQLAQNIGVRNSADATQSLSEGVGEAGAQGALFGFTAAGSVQAPGAAVEGVKTVGRTAYAGVRAAGKAALDAGKPLGRFLLDRYERFEAQNEKAAPVNEEVMSAAASDLNTNAEAAAATLKEAVDAAPVDQAEKDVATKYVDSLVQAMQFDPADAAGMGPAAETALQGATNRADAISRMASLVNRTKDEQELLNNAAVLWYLMQPVRELRLTDPKVFDTLKSDSPAFAALNQYRFAVDNVENNGTVSRALRNVETMLQQAQPTDLVKPVTEESLATPEGQKNVQAAVAIASLAPDRGNLDANEQILTHAAAGRLNLTPNQLNTLNAATSLLKARRKMEQAIAASGTRRVRDVVSSQIVAGSDPMKGVAKSAAQHTQEVLRFANSGNTEAAAASLEDFGKFVKHMKNKVNAVNQHYSAGSLPGEANRIKYQQLQPTGNREFKQSSEGLYVEPTKGSSIDLAQGMALEAEIVADVYNGLVKTFPELGLKTIEAAALNPELVGNAETLAAAFRDAKRKPEPAAKVDTIVTRPEKAETVTRHRVTDAEGNQATLKISRSKEDPTLVTDVQVHTDGEKLPYLNLGKQGHMTDEQLIKSLTDIEAINVNDNTPTGKPASTEEVGQKVEANTEERRRATAEGMTDAKLNKLIGQLQDRIMSNDGTPDDVAALAILDAEMSKRESAAVEKEKEDVRADTPTPTVRVATEPETVNVPATKTEANEQVRTTAGEAVGAERGADTRAAAPADEPTVSGTATTSEPAAVVETPLQELYGDNNFARTSFSYPDKPRTRLYAEESPIASVRKALSSESRFTAFLSGSSKRNVLTPEAAKAYQRLLSDQLAPVVQSLEQNLVEFLASPYSKSDARQKGDLFLNDGEIKTSKGEVRKGSEMNRWPNGKVLNLTQLDADGNLSYQPQMLEQASLAATQWLLSAHSYTSVMDEAGVADMTGVSETVLMQSPELVQELKEGMSLAQAKRSLSQKIRNYWGLTTNPKADLAYAEGIPDAMAAEFLRALDENGLIELKKITLTPAEHGVDTQKDFIRVVAVKQEDSEILSTFQDAIEVASIIEPEHTNYIGEEVPSVAQKQMNSEVPNTPAQKDALAKEQHIPHYVNVPVVAMYTAFGRDNLVALFGQTIDDTGVMNDTHLLSVEGRNTSITAAYDHLFSVLADVQNAATEADADIDDLPIRYAYNMSRVGRMQMLGKYSPQSSKLIREAILPTRSTLDLSNENSEEFGAYALGLAQALGIKVHNQDQAASIQQVLVMLNGPLDPAVELIRDWLSQADLSNPVQQSAELGADAVATIKQAYADAGADLSMVGLHALVDYAKFRSADDVSAFQTSLYVEADGVTNGPINAMQLMTTGEFTTSWVKNIGKGGLKFGAPQTMADVRRTDSKDLYQASTDAARTRLADLRNSLPAAGVEQMGHLLSLMSLFNSDVLYNSDMLWEDGALELKRGIAKNPLTITLYGSGEAGIAGKLTGALVGEIYARMSTLLQAIKADSNISVADAMFPGDANADAKMEQFQQAMDALTQNRSVKSSKGFFLKKVQQPARKLNPKTFKLTPAELEVMESNMLELFVKPMREGINDTVGEPLMRSVAVLRDASQVQSIFLQNMYIQKVDELLNQKEKNDPSWRRGDFLSRSELNSIAKSLSDIAPLVQTGEQSFMINSQQSMELEGRDLQYGRTLNDKLRTDPAVYAPGPAGVRAIPMLTIGMGDGMMMQLLAQQGLQGTLKIFDGMNMPLDKIRDYSERANAAVYESWKGNPHAEMLKTFEKFLASVTAADITPEMAKDLSRALNLEDAEPADLMAAMQGLRNSLDWAAKSIDARHAAIDSLPVSVDQMAAAAQPFTNGLLAIDTMSDEAAVVALNAAYSKEMTKVKVEQPGVIPPPVAEVTAPAIEQFGRVAASGVRILSPTALEKLAKTDAMTEAQKLIFGEIRRSGAADGFTVVAGTVDQLDAYIAEKGLAPRPGQDVYGWINMSDSTIFLVNPSTETLVHELVHAASYATILAYYQGADMGANAKELSIAIKNLEAMKDEFLSMTEPSAESARTAILSANLEADPAIQQAKALNEFMAWALTNDEITKDLKAKPVPAFVKMAKAVVEAIKKIIWGKKIAPKPVDDFLSNLQFNAGVVIRSQPSVGAVARDGELFHAGSSADARLDSLRAAFTSKVADLIKNDRPTKGVPLQKNVVSIAQANAVSVAMSFNAHGFPMSHKENITFRQIVAALATEAEIDTNAMDRAQELYAHVTKTLKVEDFMADPESLEPDVRYYAQEKYSTIMGQYLTTKDAQGRSSLLPAFLALATVNDEFREVLSKMPLPKSLAKKDGTLDTYLESTGTALMDSLSRRLAGDVKSTNVKSSIDNLLEHVRQIAQDDQTALDQYAAKAGGIVDRANEVVMQGLEAASSALLDKGNAMEKAATTKVTKAVAQVTKIIAAVVSEKNGATVSQGIMTATNSTKMWEPLRTFIGDLVGRTESNASVYDMIKAVRSMVQQTRQQFRDGVPAIMNGKFKKKLTADQWTAMYNTLAKTDLASLRGALTQADITAVLTDQAARDKQIDLLEQQIQYSDKRHWPAFQRKMKQLANFMNNGEPGVNLLRNAEAIARLLGEVKAKNFSIPIEADRQAMDQLITLYALDTMNTKQRGAVSSLVQSEADGVHFVLDYLIGQRKEEVRKAVGGAKYNAYKGYVPSEQEQGLSMMVAEDSEFSKLSQLGYIRVAPYKGSSVETGKPSKSYFFAPFSGRAVFNQGIMQNVRHTAGGVDASSGFTIAMTAGRITGKQPVARQLARMHQETNMVESLMPVYDKSGVLVAFERAVDPKIAAKLNKSTDLAKMIGVWRGRQVEEATSQIYNEQLIDNLKKMYDQDIKESSSNKTQYINLFSAATAKDSPVVADAVSLFTNETMDYIRKKFGTEFWVRRDMVRDAIGERSASVGDFWNGVTNMSDDHREQLRKMLVGAIGRDAYKYVVKGEEIIQNFMADMRTLIVVKSVIVPAANFVANIYQLVGRGVPMMSIAKGMPAKLGEIDSYGKTRLRQIEAEAELRAAENDPVQKRKLTVEIQAITDAHRRMSIWPLIQAGEFSSISDVGMQAEDLELTSGRLHSYIEAAVDKLPGSVRTAGRYALITKDTALYRGLQKSVQYSDFIAKAVLYDDLTKRLRLTKAEALARITEEFVNYDRLPGRFRSYLENMGLLWFYNFKIRSTKVALSTIRNNPIHALMAGVLPAPDFLGSVGSPISDNIAAKALENTLGSSVGTDMAFRAPTLNPWLNLIH